MADQAAEAVAAVATEVVAAVATAAARWAEEVAVWAVAAAAVEGDTKLSRTTPAERSLALPQTVSSWQPDFWALLRFYAKSADRWSIICL